MKYLFKTIYKTIKSPLRIVPALGSRNMLKWLPDDVYLKLFYRGVMGSELNLINPQNFNEKLQWLKLNDRNPLYTILADKYEVRKYIENIIGKEYLIPLIGVWDNFDEIDFDKLPNQFVLKCTHDSGGIVICKDKSTFNVNMAKKKINKSLKRNYYFFGREWSYKNIKPRIICEELLITEDGKLPIDYKFSCFNGEPDNVMVCSDRDSGKPKFYFFNKEWYLKRYNNAGINAPQDFMLKKPNKINEMFEIARKLSYNIPFLRVDLYFENKKIYFGELTLYPQSGFDVNLLKDTDLLFGSMIDLCKLESKKKI